MVEIKVSADAPGFATIYTDNQIMRDLLKNSPSRVWGSRCVLYPITELNDIISLAALTGDQITMCENTTLLWQMHQKKTSLLAKIRESVEKIPIPQVQGFAGKLFDYQEPIVMANLLMKRQLLALETGTGKTVISLFTAMALRSVFPAKVLVICESNQIHRPWIEKIMEFIPGTFPHLIEGDATQRAERIREGKMDRVKNWLWIASYDTMRIEVENMPLNWDLVIMDEITKAKRVSSQTSEAIQKLSAEYRLGLSATPITNTYTDLYGVMKLVNPQVFTTKKNFIDTYIQLDYFERPVGVKKGMEAALKAKLAPWMVQVVKKDVGLEKPVHISTIAVPLTKAQQEKLDEVQTEIDNGDKTSFECQTILRQICNTVKILPEYEDLPLEETTNKVKELESLLEKCIGKENKKVVLFSYFKSVVSILEEILLKKYSVRIVTGESKKTCSHADIQVCYKCPKYRSCNSVKKHVFDFVEGDVQILLGTDSLSKSHDLYTAEVVINYDLPWNSSDMKQRIGRVDRGHKNIAKEYFVYNLATLGTVEEKIIKKIERKEKDQGIVLPKYNVALSKLSSTIKVR